MKTREEIVREKSIQIVKLLQEVSQEPYLDILGSVSVKFILTVAKANSISWEESFDLFMEHFNTTLRKSVAISMKHPNSDFIKVEKN